jgi:hypothetical protein
LAVEAVRRIGAIFAIERQINGVAAERAAAMYSLIGTAKLNDVDPQAWLADVLRRIADYPPLAPPRTPKLTPDADHSAGAGQRLRPTFEINWMRCGESDGAMSNFKRMNPSTRRAVDKSEEQLS